MLLILFLILVLLIIFYWFEKHETVEESKTRSIEKDGFKVIQNPSYVTNISKLKHDILDQLPAGYQFLDYEYKIYDSTLFTFHRDVTSSKNIFNTDHPVYTMILYKSDGCLLSLCPGSHASYPFVFSRIVNIKGDKGTAFLFDSDLLHAGCVNGCEPREVFQYKICHKDDLPKLKSLQGVRMKKKQMCTDTVQNRLTRKLSYFFEFPINYFLSPFMMKKYEKGSVMEKVQSIVPITFYNNA
jgi:hypothetical protein